MDNERDDIILVGLYGTIGLQGANFGNHTVVLSP